MPILDALQTHPKLPKDTTEERFYDELHERGPWLTELVAAAITGIPRKELKMLREAKNIQLIRKAGKPLDEMIDCYNDVIATNNSNFENFNEWWKKGLTIFGDRLEDFIQLKTGRKIDLNGNGK